LPLSTVDTVLRHPLVVAALQLFVAAVLAYFGTERWQRWRQRRDFQYRTLSKLSETSTDLFVRLADMLSSRVKLNEDRSDGRLSASIMARESELRDKQRQYIDRRTAFHALEAEIMASYTTTEIMAGYYELDAKAKALFDLVQSSHTRSREHYEPIQNDFTKLRKALFGMMVVEMKLLTRTERRELQKNPTWSIEDRSGPVGIG